MNSPTTIAREWQDYAASCYRGFPPEVLSEQRLVFYSAWYACIVALGTMPIATPDEREAAREMVIGWRDEFEAHAKRYIAERRAQSQRDE